MPQRSTLPTLAAVSRGSRVSPVSRGAVALGFRRAMTGPLQGAAIVLGGVTTLACTALCASVAHGAKAGDGAAASAIAVTASALSWGAGVVLASAGASRAWHRDRDEGVFGLARARGATPAAYAAARTFGLAALLAAVVAGGTLVAGLVAIALSPGLNALLAAAGLVSSLFYAVTYSFVLAAVALAVLGARTRVGGYLALVALLAVPDAIVRGLGDALPPSARDLLSIPGALAAVREGLAAHDGDTLRTGRGFFVLTAVFFFALAVSARDVGRAETEAPS